MQARKSLLYFRKEKAMEMTSTPDYPRGVTFEQVWALLQEVGEKQKENARQMGDLHNRFGELAEHLVAPGINERFNEMGYHFGEVMPGGVKIVEDGKTKTQIDLLLENDDTVMAIEVKSKPDEDDIADHIRRLEILREYRHRKNDHRQVEGAIAGAIFGEAAKRAAVKAGLYVIVQSGDTMKIEIPDGFVPRKW